MKYTFKRAIITVMAVALLVPVAASAHEGHDHSVTDGPSKSESITDKAERYRKDFQATLDRQKTERKTKMQDKREQAKQKLGTAEKNLCERHQKKINTLIGTMNDRRQNTFDRITKISDAVQRYYTKQAISYDGYYEVVAKVAAAKSTAESAMQTQRSTTPFDCNGDQPRADMSLFKEKRSGSIDAMKLYRSAVKELVTVVKQAVKANHAAAQEGGQ